MTLIQLFTAIANQIRRLKKKSGTIKAEDFPDEMAEIELGNLTDEEYEEADEDVDDILENTTVPTGTISITENGEYDVTNYVGANVNVVSEYNVKMNTTFTSSNSTIIANITEVPVINFSGTTSASALFGSLISLKNIPLIDTSNITNMQNMFYNCSSLTTIPLLDTSKVTNMNSMFYGCSGLTTIPQLNTSSSTNMWSMFQSCVKLTTIPLLDTSNVTIMMQMFFNCPKLTEIPQLDTSNVTNFQMFCSSCGSLEIVPQLNASKATNFSSMFTGCSKLNNTSLNNILGMLANATDYINQGTNMTLRYIGLSSSQATTCTGLSNWASAQSAGWTTGY